MQINRIEINHLENPIGFDLDNHLHVAGFLDDNKIQILEKKLILRDEEETVFDSNWLKANDLIFDFAINLKPRKKYELEMLLKTKEGIISKKSVFETGKMSENFHGKWIGTHHTDLHSIIFEKGFETNSVDNARLYITALGLYEVYIDDQKIGDEFLTPGFTDYNYYVQVQTYNVSSYLKHPGKHKISIMVADGWYRGKFGLKTHGGQSNNYGTRLTALADLVIKTDSDEKVIATDESWKILASPVTHSGIYYGGDLDENQKNSFIENATLEVSPTKYLLDRKSLPITKHEEFKPKQIIHTAHGDTVLDFGQNLAGWLVFKNHIPKGEKIRIEFGEIMQDGEFYRDNLRSARAQFTYVSDGQDKWVRPHFTYFGFRYAKILDFPSNYNESDFKAVALYSDLRETGSIKTDNPKINRLFENIKWGQKSNFIDIPTDCPQRDERLGWSGDAAIFAQTASYNMEIYQFFKKFSFDIAVEQSKLNGKVPLYIPAVDTTDGGKAVWSDVATIIPWTAFQITGDAAILRQNIGAMMSWIDWIHDRALENGNEYLWLGDDQLGDWLALDTEDIMKLKGKTSDDLIASAYYYYSTLITSQAAQVLDKKHEYQYYHQLAKLIKDAFIKRFFTSAGLPIANTQTGLALCLNLGLYPKNGKNILIQDLIQKIEINKNHLDTGFVGTPQLLPALSENGQADLALKLFLNEDFPSWLYEVNHGATTIWERWNSVDEKGKIADNGMNSLNHYSSGAVIAWAYRDLLGIRQEFNSVTFSPIFTAKFKKISGQILLPTGLIQAAWEIINRTKIRLHMEIPFGSKVKLSFPAIKTIMENNQKLANKVLQAGTYDLELISYEPIIDSFDIHTPLKEYKDDKKLTNQIKEFVPFWTFLTLGANMENFKDYSLYQLSREMRGIGFKPFNKSDIQKINQVFKNYALTKR